ncbi:MAG: hypothetical protein WCQ16_02765 [Verrucomicrobiae bacterium]
MKKLLLLSILAATTAMAAPSAKVVSAYDEAKRVQLIEWVEQLRVKAGEAADKAAKAEASLATSEAQRQAAQVNLATLQSEIVRLTQWGVDQQTRANEQEARANKAEKARDAAISKYHTIKFYVGGTLAILMAAMSLLLILKWGGFALNTWVGAACAFGIPAAVGAATFAFIWFRL